MAKDAVMAAFGKKLADLTGEERTLWRRAVRMASYYRKHERNKAQARKDASWRKLEILDVLGWDAACSRCGYDRYIGALDFHHIDPDTKVDSVLNVLRADAIEEARKCILLCKNCHCEEHASKPVSGTGRPTAPMHPKVAAYLRAVGVSRPGDVGRLGDGTVCEEAGSVLVSGAGWVKDISLTEPSSRSIVCKTSGTAQCTCPPNGICNDCTVPLALW